MTQLTDWSDVSLAQLLEQLIQDSVIKELEAKNTTNVRQHVCMEIISCQTKLFYFFLQYYVSGW